MYIPRQTRNIGPMFERCSTSVANIDQTYSANEFLTRWDHTCIHYPSIMIFFPGLLVSISGWYDIPFVVSGAIGVCGCIIYGAGLFTKRRHWCYLNESSKGLLDN